MRFFYIAFISIVFLGCQPRSQETEQSSTDLTDSTPEKQALAFPPLVAGEVSLTDEAFGPLVELTGEVVETDAIFTPKELDMLIKGDLMIMKTFSSTGIFKVLSLPDLKLLKEFGVKGKGPGEFLFPRLVWTDEPDKLCYIYDMQLEKLYSVDMEYNILEFDAELEKESESLFGDKQFFEYEQNSFYYVSKSTTGKGIYQYLPERGDSLRLAYDLEDGFKSNLGWSAMIGDFGGNRILGRMVFAYKFFHKIRFYDYNNKATRTISFDSRQNANVKAKDHLTVLAPTGTTHFWGMSSQAEHVYCLYSGRSPIDVGKQINAGTDYIFIEQFDWNGNPIARYRLDQWGYFCVDEARRTIYVAAVNDEFPMYKYSY